MHDPECHILRKFTMSLQLHWYTAHFSCHGKNHCTFTSMFVPSHFLGELKMKKNEKKRAAGCNDGSDKWGKKIWKVKKPPDYWPRIICVAEMIKLAMSNTQEGQLEKEALIIIFGMDFLFISHEYRGKKKHQLCWIPIQYLFMRQL